MTEYGRIHTDGSRSGGQPLIANRKAHTMLLEVLAEWGIAVRNATAQQLAVATTEALCRAIDQQEDLRQPTQSDALAKCLAALDDEEVVHAIDCNKVEQRATWDDALRMCRQRITAAMRQPTQSDIFDVCDVQKHTLIIDQDYASHTVKVKSLNDSQPTQSDALKAAASALLADVRRRHPNEDLRCKYMIALGAALQEQSK